MRVKILLQTAFLALGVFSYPLTSLGQASSGQVSSDYKIGASDVLIIDLVGEKDLPHEFPVSGNGTITYPFLDQVSVAGKTSAEIRDILTAMLDKDYFV